MNRIYLMALLILLIIGIHIPPLRDISAYAVQVDTADSAGLSLCSPSLLSVTSSALFCLTTFHQHLLLELRYLTARILQPVGFTTWQIAFQCKTTFQQTVS